MDLITIVKQAEYRLLHEGRHHPTIKVAFEDLPIVAHVPLSSLPATPEQRQHRLFLQGRQFADQYGTRKITKIWFISEARVSTADPRAPYAIAPSLDPKRREALLILELDASSTELAQHIELRAIQRTRSGVVKAVQPMPSFSSQEASDTLIGALVLAFLAGFAEASTHPHAYGPVHRKMFWHQLQMEQ